MPFFILSCSEIRRDRHMMQAVMSLTQRHHPEVFRGALENVHPFVVPSPGVASFLSVDSLFMKIASDSYLAPIFRFEQNAVIILVDHLNCCVRAKNGQDGVERLIEATEYSLLGAQRHIEDLYQLKAQLDPSIGTLLVFPVIYLIDDEGRQVVSTVRGAREYCSDLIRVTTPPRGKQRFFH